jgi:hypothetical protein
MTDTESEGHVTRADLRMKRAMMVYAARNREQQTDHAFWAAMAGDAQGLGRPVPPERVAEWMNGTSVPPFQFMIALGEAVGYNDIQAAFLLYGNEHTIHGMTEADYQRCHGRKPSDASRRAP